MYGSRALGGLGLGLRQSQLCHVIRVPGLRDGRRHRTSTLQLGTLGHCALLWTLRPIATRICPHGGGRTGATAMHLAHVCTELAACSQRHRRCLPGRRLYRCRCGPAHCGSGLDGRRPTGAAGIDRDRRLRLGFRRLQRSLLRRHALHFLFIHTEIDQRSAEVPDRGGSRGGLGSFGPREIRRDLCLAAPFVPGLETPKKAFGQGLFGGGRVTLIEGAVRGGGERSGGRGKRVRAAVVRAERLRPEIK